MSHRTHRQLPSFPTRRSSDLIHVQDLREFTKDRHRTVDDRPFGGGEGMVLKPAPLFEAVESLVGHSAGHASKPRSEEHTSELQSRENLVCRLLLEKKNRHPVD